MTKKNEIIIIDEKKDLKAFRRRMAELLEKRRSGELPGSPKTSCNSV